MTEHAMTIDAAAEATYQEAKKAYRQAHDQMIDLCKKNQLAEREAEKTVKEKRDNLEAAYQELMRKER